MGNYQQGEVVYVNLNPTKGCETNKRRPCVIVSNHHYNRLLNTVIVAPISHSPKYVEEKRYSQSPLFVTLPENGKIRGTVLLQTFAEYRSEG